MRRIHVLGLLLALLGPARARADDQPCITVPRVAATDDNYGMWIAPVNETLVLVGCHCDGTCGSPTATFSFAHRSGAAVTLTGGVDLACSTGGASTTFVAVTGGGSFTSGEGLMFNVTNTPLTHDRVTICAKFTIP